MIPLSGEDDRFYIPVEGVVSSESDEYLTCELFFANVDMNTYHVSWS